MLLNIVRSRYLEVPVFLTVSSVLTQYEYDSSLGLGAIVESGAGTNDIFTGDTNLSFSERPTITYLPVEGQEFSAHLLSDIPSEIIFAAAQAGWAIDFFMRIGIQRLGAAENMPFGDIPATGYGDSKTQFKTERVTNIKDDEISIQTRSVMAIMEFMARGVEVPLAYLEEGRVIDYGLHSSEGQAAQGLIPFRMHSSKNRPQNVFAAVRFNNYWYYIDHADITSKRALGLIIVLFRLQAPTPAGAAPILTLPTG